MSKITESVCENCKKSFHYAAKNHKGRFCSSECWRLKRRGSMPVVPPPPLLVKEPVQEVPEIKPQEIPEPIIKRAVFSKTLWEKIVDKVRSVCSRSDR